MIQLDVEVPDQPGELAKVLDLLATEKVNIDAMCANSGDGRSYVSLITDQPVKARQSLRKAGYTCTQRTVIVISLPDGPGALAAVVRKLSGAGVDIKSVVPLESVGNRVQLAIGADDVQKARALV